MNGFQNVLSNSSCAASSGPTRRSNVESARGRAVQVDPITPKLKPPETKRLKLKCDILLSNYGFKFSLRRYIGGLVQLLCLALLRWAGAG